MPETLPPLEFSIEGAEPFRLLHVPGGSFDMGGADEDAYADEKPVHRVTLPGFYMGEFLVTQDLWAAVVPESPHPSRFRGARRPVEQVSWYDAAVFCNRLNERLGKQYRYYADVECARPFGREGTAWALPEDGVVQLRPGACGFRLPSEAEWEYAARGGPETNPWKYAGSDQLKEVAWFIENNHLETKPVGLKAPNALGLYDMSGNVWEWCEDQWHDNYDQKGRPDDGSPWVDDNPGASRVDRGGGWLDNPQRCRAACRNLNPPASRWRSVGFRLVFPLQAVGSRPAVR